MSSTIGAIGEWLLNATCAMFYVAKPSDLALDGSDPMPQYLLKYGIPMFFILMLVERAMMVVRDLVWPLPKKKKEKENVADKAAADTPARKLPTYRLNDMIVSTILGTFQTTFLLIFDLLGCAIEIGVYQFVYEHFRLTEISAKGDNMYWVYFALMFGKDLAYYWAHRMFHEFHIAWVGHSVHHSGEDYNLATGLRQGAVQPLFGWPFYLPMALLGFHPHAFAAHAQLNTLYMYWIHTDVVGRLPLGLEYIFNSPMAHRMHHRPPGNCNYAGMFIFWDRIFGTYTPELVRKDYFGLAKQPNTFDPLKLNVNHLNRMADIGKPAGAPANTGFGGLLSGAWAKNVFRRRVKARWVCRPLAIFDPIPPLKEDARNSGPVREKWDGAAPVPAPLALYLVVCSLAALGGAVFLLLKAHSMHIGDATLGIAVAGAAMSCIGRMADNDGPGESGRAVGVSMVALAGLWGLILTRPLEQVFAPGIVA